MKTTKVFEVTMRPEAVAPFQKAGIITRFTVATTKKEAKENAESMTTNIAMDVIERQDLQGQAIENDEDGYAIFIWSV